MSKTRRLTALSLLTAASLCVFVLEAQIPPLIPAVPGVKLGLANVFTLFAIQVLGAPDALALLLVRVTVGSFVTGQVAALGYSLCGGLASYAVLLLLRRQFPLKQLWALSVLCAVAHNLGQLMLAAFVMGSSAVLWYLPVLILAALLSGAFAGLACQLVLLRLRKSRLWKREEKSE